MTLSQELEYLVSAESQTTWRLFQEARLNRAYMGGVERGQRNVGIVNLYRVQGLWI